MRIISINTTSIDLFLSCCSLQTIYFLIDDCAQFLRKNKIRKTYRIHQLVYICNNPTEDIIGFDIDHIDCDKTNNKIENLRKCSHSDNCSNAKTQKNNKSTGIKYIYKTKCGYRFQLTKNGIKYSKRFKTIEEAREHRNRVVLEKCGAFTNLG